MTRELRWLVRQTRPFLPAHALRGGLILAGALLAVLEPLLLRRLLDGLIAGANPRTALASCLLLLATGLTRLGVNSASSLLGFSLGQATVARVKARLLAHLQHLPVPYHQRRSVGERLFLLDEVDQLGELTGDWIPGSCQILLHLAFSLAAMVWLDPLLGAIVLVGLPLLLLLRTRFRDVLGERSQRCREALERSTAFLQDHLAGIVDVQLLGCERQDRRRALQLQRQVRRSRIRRRTAELALGMSSLGLLALASALVLAVGSTRVSRGELTVGGLVAFTAYLTRFFYQGENLTEIFTTLERVRVTVRGILSCLDEMPQTGRAPRRSSPSLHGRLELERVSFTYPDGRPALADVSCAFEPGERVAVVGHSGCGKSTLVNLLARVYEPTSGRIRLAGEDIATLPLSSLRSAVGLVRQDAALFEGSLRDNLLRGAPGASLEELSKAASVARLEALVDRLDDGWDTAVGARGCNLSGGQGQRAAIARMLLKRPAILVLDEVTAALDEDTEGELFAAIDRLVPRPTVLSVTHRLSSLRRVDRVLVLENGRLVLQGPPHSLFDTYKVDSLLPYGQAPDRRGTAELTASAAASAGGSLSRARCA